MRVNQGRALFSLLCLGMVVLAGCIARPAITPTEKDWSHDTQGLPFVIGYAKGMEKARSEGKPAMVFVTATWCKWCRRLAEESFNDPKVRQMLSKCVCVIVDADEEGDVKSQLGAEGVPYIVFLSPDGEFLGECLGYKPVSQFEPIVKEALAAARGETASSPDRS